MEVANKIPITFTEGALKELVRLKEAGSADKPYLRVGVKGGGCSGLTYVLEYDEKTEKDTMYTLDNGIEVIMEQAHEMYLVNVEVNFEGGLSSRGFTFSNPNASDTCGCGTSFSV